MRIAVLAESPADREVVAVLVEAVLRETVDVAHEPVLEVQGWPQVVHALPAVIRHLHYRSTVEGLIVLADSDDAPLEEGDRGSTGSGLRGEPRLSSLQRSIQNTQSSLRSARPQPLRVAVALAVPALEAWLLHGVDNSVGEANWLQARSEGRLPYTRADLKRKVYGSDRPSLHTATRVGLAEAARVAARIDTLAQFFPRGFGRFADELRSWKH